MTTASDDYGYEGMSDADPYEAERLKKLKLGKTKTHEVQLNSTSQTNNSVPMMQGLEAQQEKQSEQQQPAQPQGTFVGLSPLSQGSVADSAGLRSQIGGSFLSGLLGGSGLSQEQTNFMGNQAIGKVVGAAFGPIGSGVYGIARALGFNPTQGISELVNYSGTPGYQGGFWGVQGIGEGLDPYSQAPAPVETRPGFDNSYTPANFSLGASLPNANGSGSGNSYNYGSGNATVSYGGDYTGGQGYT